MAGLTRTRGERQSRQTFESATQNALSPGLSRGRSLGSRVSRELLPKSEVLEGERATRREDRAEDPDQEGHEKAHGAAILPRPRMLTIPRVYEVFADHEVQENFDKRSPPLMPLPS